MIVAKNLWHGKTTFTVALLRAEGRRASRSSRTCAARPSPSWTPASSSGYIYPMVMLIQRGLVKNRDPKTFFREVGVRGLARRLHARAAQRPRGRHRLVRHGARAVPEGPGGARARHLGGGDAADPRGGHRRARGADPALFARVRAALLQIRAPAYAALLKRLYDIDGFEPAEDGSTIPCGRPSTCSAPPADRAPRPRRVPAGSAVAAHDRGARPPRRPPAGHRDPRRRRPHRRGRRVRGGPRTRAAPARRRCSARSTGSSSPPRARCAWPAARSRARAPPRCARRAGGSA